MAKALDGKHSAAALALGEGATVAEAAEAAGVSASTVSRWQREEHFAALIRVAADDAALEHRRSLRALKADAGATVARILKGGEGIPAAVQLRAALAILGDDLDRLDREPPRREAFSGVSGVLERLGAEELYGVRSA